MKTPSHLTIRPSLLAALAILAMANLASAQVTNWIAYNDHRPGPLIPPHVPTPNSWGTATNVTSIDMGDPGSTATALVDHRTGNPLPAMFAAVRTGGADGFGTLGRPMPTNSPMAQLFLGICDLSNDGLVGVRTNATDHRFVTVTISGLDPTKRYVFRGTTARNGGYGNRWSFAAISAAGWTDAHANPATGPGVLTANNFPAGGFAPGQAAFNSGSNPEGAVVGWNDIAPFPDGTFSIFQDQYVGPIPGGVANNGPYGYAFTAMMLAEVEIVAPTITANPAASTTVEQNRPFSLSVSATGAPLNYQWYKTSTGEIPGATLATYTLPLAQVGDSDSYYAVVYNSLARRTSTVAQVTVFADVTPPAVESIFAYPHVDAGGVATLDQIVVEFSEPVTPASVGSPANYVVPGGGNPVSVVVTNERSVVLMLGTPLSEDTDYSVTLSGGATDAAGNVAGGSSAPFHSWVPGPGNGLLMESYDVPGTDITVESLVANPNYPNNPFRRDIVQAFDSRLVFPDDNREGYGARISGVFIPPVSGSWIFFARTRNLGLVKLNPNGTDPAGAIEILRQSTENAPFNWDRLSSSVYALRAGRPYYIEGLYKGATGPDYLKVAARLAGTGVPTPVDTLDTQVDANSMTGGYIGSPLAPKNLGGALSIVQDLANVTAEENNPVTFSIQLTNPSKLPLQFQWYRDGAEILGANGATYTINPTIAADNGATFSVRVAKVGSVVNSRTAILNVVPDVTGPRALDANNSFATPRFITVRFNEPLFLNDAQESFNYSITDLVTIGATLQPDRTTVLVEMFSELTAGQNYQLKIENVTDLVGLTISPNPTFLPLTGASDLPKLAIVLNHDYVDITWPITSTAFVLEQANELSSLPGGTAWSDAGVTPSIVDGRNFVSLSVGPGKMFFRLRQ